jgi:glutamine amidotransferase
MIAIIDYGLGNVQAFANIYKELGVPFLVARTADDLRNATRAILPGVGAFDQAMKRLQESGMRSPLDDMALRRRQPVIGVCVGMQILMGSSEEGRLPGLGWIDGEVVRFSDVPGADPMHVPHMGWNNVAPCADQRLFQGLEADARFYFLHSYYVRCRHAEDALATTQYGGQFVSAVRRANIYGVQFHPEKSHGYGIQLLKNFAEL